MSRHIDPGEVLDDLGRLVYAGLVSVVLLGAMCTVVFAQSAPAPSSVSTVQERIAKQLGTLVIENASLGVQNEQLTSALSAASAEVKRLRDKYEPNKSAPESKP